MEAPDLVVICEKVGKYTGVCILRPPHLLPIREILRIQPSNHPFTMCQLTQYQCYIEYGPHGKWTPFPYRIWTQQIHILLYILYRKSTPSRIWTHYGIWTQGSFSMGVHIISDTGTTLILVRLLESIICVCKLCLVIIPIVSKSKN